MTIYTEGNHALEFVLDADAESYDVGTLVSGQNLVSGAVLGKITAGASSTIAASAITGTGNGVITAGSIGGLAKSGIYRATCTNIAANAGVFSIYSPLDDVFIADVTVGAGAVSVGNHFTVTIADGTTDFALGDYFTITIVLPPAQWTAHNPAAVDGSETAAGILAYDVDATSAAQPATILVRDASVYDSKLTWKVAITAAQKKTAIAALDAKTIVVRS